MPKLAATGESNITVPSPRRMSSRRDQPDVEHSVFAPAFFVSSLKVRNMELVAYSVLVPILCLLLMPCLPASAANQHVRILRRMTTSLVAVEFLLASLLGLGHLAGGTIPLAASYFEFPLGFEVSVSVLHDGAAGLMLLLVAFISVVVSHFSTRYLDGEASQGRFFLWLGFTIGAVSLLVIAGNLALFFAAWVLTSVGLHQLLLHYGDRPAARRAAWTKFAISRLGDAFLLAAFALIYKLFATLDIATVVKQAQSVAEPTATHEIIAWLLVLGAVTKSAQFPFHVWLPDTMETPTPVSALMHAGIVNAGGYLLIRLSPLVTLAPSAMLMLAVFGTVTACFGSVVMTTQPSVKRGLAYSTVAQMGFMMLQCGMGAFAAAMMHIIAHSLYKAHAFLSSGSVVAQSQATAAVRQPESKLSVMPLLAAATSAAACIAVVFQLMPIGNVAEKPGGIVLSLILFLALTGWGWRVVSLGRLPIMMVAFSGMLGLSLAYAGGYVLVHQLLHPTAGSAASAGLGQVVSVAIATAFGLLFAFQALLQNSVQPQWLAPLRIHAANAFYVPALYQRLLRLVAVGQLPKAQ